MALVLLNLYKRIISYDRAKLKKVGNFYALTWLIFAGPVTYLDLLSLSITIQCICEPIDGLQESEERECGHSVIHLQQPKGKRKTKAYQSKDKFRKSEVETVLIV